MTSDSGSIDKAADLCSENVRFQFRPRKLEAFPSLTQTFQEIAGAVPRSHLILHFLTHYRSSYHAFI